MAFFNPFRPAYLEDPYPSLHQLRSQEPVHWSRDLEAWVVTSYAECLQALQDTETFSSDPVRGGGPFGQEVARRRAEAPLGMAPIMGNSDGADHMRLRAIVNRGFTPRVMESMRPGIERAVESLLAEADPSAPFEVMSGFAEPLAVSVVLEHLGIPREDFGRFREWSLALMRARAEGGAQPGVLESAGRAQGEMFDYVAQLAEMRDAKHDAAADIVSVLLDACDEEAIAPEEMLMMLIHISLAGNGPTAMALGNGIAALGAQPEGLARFIADPELTQSAIEELLRFDSSTHFVVRFATAATRLGTRPVRPGQHLHLMVGAANRDPARFERPDTIDLGRTDNRHLSFGYGVHFCLGAPLARLELAIGLRRFVERFGEFVTIEREVLPNYQLRGLRRLVIKSESST